MTGEQSLNEQDSDTDRLIRDAYSVVADPERLFDLQMRLERAFHNSAGTLDTLGDHIEHVGALFDRIHLGPGADFAEMSLVPIPAGEEGRRGPVLTLDAGLQVLAVSPDVFDGVETGQTLPDWVFGPEPSGMRRVREMLVQARHGEPTARFLRLHESENDARGFLVLGRCDPESARTEIQCERVMLSWSERDGERFAAAMGLSASESELTRYIVEGRSIADFAKDRGTAVGTARNQMKAVLRKLGIGSQSELVSLFAGFANSLALHEVAGAQTAACAFGRTVDLTDGSTLQYERYGKAGGRPVLLFHGAIEGPYFTPSMQQAAQRAGLEIFVPWMPFYADHYRKGDPLGQVERFTDKMGMFLDAAKIKRAAVVGASVSCAYALAMTARHPDRIAGTVLCALPLPFDAARVPDGINPFWRAPLVLGRHAPGFTEMLVRAIVRLAMRGEAYLYFDRLLKDSPLDRETLRRPDVASVVRKAFANRPDKAGRSLGHALLIQTADWGDWLKPGEVPVSVLIGASDVVHAPELQLEFCRRHGWKTIGPIDGVGGFSLFQDPYRVFGEARTIFDR